MAQLLVRNIPPELIEALKRRAAEHGRSAEAEHRLILEDALWASREAFKARAKQLREATSGRTISDTTAIIRTDRDTRR